MERLMAFAVPSDAISGDLSFPAPWTADKDGEDKCPSALLISLSRRDSWSLSWVNACLQNRKSVEFFE